MRIRRPRATIQMIHAREVLDSRGNPTIEADVQLTDGSEGRAAVPSGLSTGRREAREPRDGDPDRYGGMGVLRAVGEVNELVQPVLVGQGADDQRRVDEQLIELDGTPDKSRLGAGAMLAVSQAIARAAAAHLGVPLYRYVAHLAGTTPSLPIPMVAVIEGGLHADNSLDVQEFMIVPQAVSAAAEGIRRCAEVFHVLGATLRGRGTRVAVGDEGGYAPECGTSDDALDAIVAAIRDAGYRPNEDIGLALDVAASELYRGGRYVLDRSSLTSDAMVARLGRLVTAFPIVSVEDGVSEVDRDGWSLLTRTLGSRVMLVADDLFATDPALVRRGVRDGLANAVLIKPNQVGTLSESLDAIAAARKGGYRVVVSHRSGDTEDSFIADLAVGVRAEFIKAGAPCRSERLAKYNQLIRIEEELAR